MAFTVESLIWSGTVLRVLDQRVLPLSEVWIDCGSAAEVADAIHSMAVRGAPAIGIAAAYGVALDALAGRDRALAAERLARSRPTAVNLHWALKRMAAMAEAGASPERLLAEARAIHEEDREQNRRIGELGARLLPDSAVVITHCNTGSLATGGHGTALGIIRSAHVQGKIREVFACETRPWLQGARLTAWELMREGIPARLIADSAAAHLMRSTRIDAVIVGADRIAANGDTANKIGTYALAVAARAHGVKFIVAAPSGTFDLNCADGSRIPIEERPGTELTEFRGQAIAPPGIEAWNPVFDITPAAWIDALVCERGVAQPPNVETVLQMLDGSFSAGS